MLQQEARSNSVAEVPAAWIESHYDLCSNDEGSLEEKCQSIAVAAGAAGFVIDGPDVKFRR